MVIDHLIPYPAAMERQEDGVIVRLLDFDGVAASGADFDSAIRGAQDALLRKLLMLIRSAEPIPSPDQYLDPIPDHVLVMIDPMSLEAA